MQLSLDLRVPRAEPSADRLASVQPATNEATQTTESAEPSAPSSRELEHRRRQLTLELRMHLGTNVALVLHTNRQSMLSAERTRLGFLVRAHRIFAAAPADVIVAIARLLDANDRVAANIIDRYIDACSDTIAAHARPSQIQARGTFYDLQRIFDELNARYFSGAVNSRITWGRAGKARRRRSIKLGSYHASERLIRIHPALDQAYVPSFFIAFVVFHEMLHEQLGTSERSHDGRRCVHPPEFRALEARFPQAAEALQWEHDNLNRLLRYKGP